MAGTRGHITPEELKELFEFQSRIKHEEVECEKCYGTGVTKRKGTHHAVHWVDCLVCMGSGTVPRGWDHSFDDDVYFHADEYADMHGLRNRIAREIQEEEDRMVFKVLEAASLKDIK